MEIILVAFPPKKILLGQTDHLGPKAASPHDSASIVRIVLQFCIIPLWPRETLKLY